MARREFEYKRHGTCSLFINFDVATGQVFSPSSGPTGTEADLVVDNLDIHRSESLVRYVAEVAGCRDDLGVK